METITLRTQDGWWLAHSTDPKVARLFGTSEIPTAYRDTMAASVVRERIAALNPSERVVVAILASEKGRT